MHVYSLFAAQITFVAVERSNNKKIVNKHGYIFVIQFYFYKLYKYMPRFRVSKYVRGTSAEVDA